MSELIDSKFALFQFKMDQSGQELTSLRLRMEVAESELSALRGCVLSAAAKGALKPPALADTPGLGSASGQQRTQRASPHSPLKENNPCPVLASQDGHRHQCQDEAVGGDLTPTCGSDDRRVDNSSRAPQTVPDSDTQCDKRGEPSVETEVKPDFSAEGKLDRRQTKTPEPECRERSGHELKPDHIKVEEDPDMDLDVIELSISESDLVDAICEPQPVNESSVAGQSCTEGSVFPDGVPNGGATENVLDLRHSNGVCDGTAYKEPHQDPATTASQRSAMMSAAAGDVTMKTEPFLELPQCEEREQVLPTQTASCHAPAPDTAPAPLTRQQSPAATIKLKRNLKTYQPIPNLSALPLLPSMILRPRKDSEAEKGLQQPVEQTQGQGEDGFAMDTPDPPINIHQRYPRDASPNNLSVPQSLRRSRVPSMSVASGDLYICTECGRTFKLLGNLKAHQRLHAGDGRRQNVGNKDIDEAGNPREPVYHCTECGKGFRHFRSLQRHWKTHTGERPYHCGECGKDFHLLESLKAHQRIHTGERPHICPQCGKRFSEVQNLRVHLRIHSGETPYPCPQCGKSFRQFQHLKRHRLVHTKLQ
ncbi:ZN551 protein, partial [Amia calva]|nr:ZN551 protein [Amia calva]